MNGHHGSKLPALPLVLWETPPALELILAQEGVPFVKPRAPNPLAMRAGRFVLHDGKRLSSSRLKAMLSQGHQVIDIDPLRDGEEVDPFLALVDNHAAPATWTVNGIALTERVARRPKAAIRRRIIGRLRSIVTRAGGHWVRIAPYPYPYRSAFHFRADLDETAPDDYARFARARRPLDDCTTHFLSTHAYRHHPEVLSDLLGLDTQSHGHFHHIYKDSESNRSNIERAHKFMMDVGFEPEGFAAPEGRWNPGLDAILEDAGYRYSSDFHLGYDDLPFFPWLGDRFSTVLQAPVHPICEGLFFDAGETDARAATEHLLRVLRVKIDAREPAFLYGHPERRLGRFPQLVTSLAAEIAAESLLWRVTMTQFARWWKWRSERRWSLVTKREGRFEIQFDEWDNRYPIALEISRGGHFASLPVTAPCIPLRLDALSYERCPPPSNLPTPVLARRRRGLKTAVRAAIDWETVTPIEDLVGNSFAARLKKGLRRWKSRSEPDLVTTGAADSWR